MDRVAAMLLLSGLLVTLLLLILALFAYAPIFCSCLLSLLYTLYLFMAYEEHTQSQEFENRFWTIFAGLLSTLLVFAKDSPMAFGQWSPSLGFVSVVLSAYAMHTWDRYLHRKAISRQLSIRRNTTATSSLVRLKALGIPVEDQLERINGCLKAIDQVLIPSTINNFINQRFVLAKEREVISIFAECDARALNYLINHVKMGLLFYKIKDHQRSFSRTELIQLLAVDRLAALTIMSRVIVLHALQLMKLRANPRAEYWVRNIVLSTHQDDLSELKTLMDAKGDYFCMKKLLYDDIKSQSIRHDILNHIRREAAVQQAHIQMGTKKAKRRLQQSSWRKILSDVDDTLTSSGGSYPAGIDRRYVKKVVYPGVLAFYRELDLGTQGPEEWPENRVGNLVFLSARPHVYKDVSEKINFAKFEKLRVDVDGRKRLHTVPSLLAGDLASGTEYMMTNDMEPLALKKYDNFQRYVSIYPEYKHIFVCDNGQGDVRAGEMMFDAHPYEFEALYVHVVQDIQKTHGYDPAVWKEKGFEPCFFRTYPEAALHAVTRNPPLIRKSGLQRICIDTVKDFHLIRPKQWPSLKKKIARRAELNQGIWRANEYLTNNNMETVPYIEASRAWQDGEQVRTPYGIATVFGFDPVWNLYEVELDWRPIPMQVEDHLKREKEGKPRTLGNRSRSGGLETVLEAGETDDDELDPSYRDDSEARTTDDIRPKVSSDQESLPSESQTEPTTLAQVEKLVDECTTEEPKQYQPRVAAKIHARNISKYTPPTLPRLSKNRGKLFTFWGPETKHQFNAGDKCTTPYGPGIVKKHSVKKQMVVVDMVGWTATAYLAEGDVKPMSKSLFGSFLRQFSSNESGSKVANAPRPLEFPYASGTSIRTPFGDAKVTRPLPLDKGKSSNKDGIDHHTIELSLTDWMLADESHPKLFCTVETARKWKDAKWKKSTSSQKGIFSVFNLVSKTLLATTRVGRGEEDSKVDSSPKFERYFREGAAVTTPYGDGVVDAFRETDGVYHVQLIRWELVSGICAMAYMQRDSIQHRVAPGCQEGKAVWTRMGLSGTLASIGPTTGVHIVTVPSAGMVCYLQPSEIICPLKAAVTETVFTAYGEGKVERYDHTSTTYKIRLNGWNATLFAKADALDRAIDFMNERQGSFGVQWLLSFFSFTADENTNRNRTRSLSALSAD